MSGHTKGQWQVTEEIGGLGGIVASLGQTMEDESYFIRSDMLVRDEDLPGNARLIAAAPDQNYALICIDGRLQAIDGALEGLVIFGKRDKKVRDAIRDAGVLVRGAQRIARAAIAKADGSTD